MNDHLHNYMDMKLESQPTLAFLLYNSREQTCHIRFGAYTTHGFAPCITLRCLVASVLHVAPKLNIMNQRNEMTNHHRKPKSCGGTNNPRNISKVRRKFHEAYHLLFSNDEPMEVAKKLSEVWIDPDFIMVAIPRNKLHAVIKALM